MIKRLSFVAVSILLTSLFFTSANAFNSVPQIKLEDFVKPRSARDVQISPDGKHFSMVFRKDGQELLAILEAETKKVIRTFRVFGERTSVGDVHWVTNERLVYGINESYAWDERVRDTGQLAGVNIDGTHHKLIFGYQSGQQQTGSLVKKKQADYGSHEIIDILPDDDKHILIAFYPWRADEKYWRINPDVKAQVHRLNVFNGNRRKVDTMPMPQAFALADTQGNVRFSVALNKSNRLEVHYKKDKNSDWQPFKVGDFQATSVLPLSFADEQKVYVTARVENGTRALFLLDLEAQKFEKLFHNEEVDISSYVWDLSERKVVAVATELHKPEYFYLDKKDQLANLHSKLRKAFQGYDIDITSATKTGDKVVVRAYSDFSPSDYYLFETKSLKAELLISSRAWIDPNIMAETEGRTFKARDGSQFYGYLTRPLAQKQNLPLIVMPHGGPHQVRDWWGFDWEVQLLANRGYAVLQVNYRGSFGFGDDFETAGYGEWGGLMQDDITDATLALVNDKIVDKKRICIYGHSYGGYAALMGAARDPELYQCAVGSMGVYNLPMMFSKGDISERQSGLAYLREVLGTDAEAQKKRSPAYNADKIKADLLLIHGGLDARAPIEQAESMKDALDKAGKSYDWLELGTEGHGYNDIDNRMKIYSKLLEFIDQSIGPAAANTAGQ